MLTLPSDVYDREVSPDRSRRLYFVTHVVVITTLVMGLFVSSADAAKRRGHRNNRRASAMAQAQRNEAIKNIQQQVAAAQRVLSSAQFQASMSQTQVSEAMSKINKISSDIEVAHDDVQQASKALREIEAEIIAEQTPDSEYGKTKAAFDEAQRASHLIIHRLAGLSGTIEATESRSGLLDVAKLNPEQQAAIEADSAYQSAERSFKVAADNLSRLRKKLFESDSDWTAGQRELLDAKSRSSEDTRQVTSVGLEARRDKRQLNQAQQLVWEARRVIAQGEARLRQLGAKPLASKSPSSKPKQTK